MKESNGTLIDSKVSSNQAKLALDALLKHSLKHKADKEKDELLPGKEQFVWLTIAVKKIHVEKKLKPYKIPLKHPLLDPRTTPICLITKDPQREYKDLLESHNIKFISRVVGIQKLKGKFKPFEARRMLLKENGLFLADERVVPLLPKLLGKPFFTAKKQPIPVCMTRKELKKELEQAVSSTYFHQNQGTCASIKIGTLGTHDSTQLLDNITTALPSIVKNVQGQWTNVQSIHVKTNSSASLPVWSCELDKSEGGRWDGLTKPPDVDDDKKEEEEDKEEESSEAEEQVVEVEVKKGKKRAGMADEEPQKKKKRVKMVEEKSTGPSPGSKSNSDEKAAKKVKVVEQETSKSKQEDPTKKQKQVKKKDKTKTAATTKLFGGPKSKGKNVKDGLLGKKTAGR